MCLIIFILLSGAGACGGLNLQKLRCPYEVRHKTLPRVWCKQNSTQCCTGLSFSPQTQVMHGGKLEVTQDSDSFTVAIVELPYGEGVYWCGVLSLNDTIIRLAASYFHSSSGAFIWSITRWILLPLLPMLTIFISFSSRRAMKHINKEEEDLYDDIMTPVLSEINPQCKPAAPKPVYEIVEEGNHQEESFSPVYSG